MTFRVSWHDGFGGTHTAETKDPRQFRHDLGKVDWFCVDGGYFPASIITARISSNVIG